jgi:hypothetical protein
MAFFAPIGMAVASGLGMAVPAAGGMATGLSVGALSALGAGTVALGAGALYGVSQIGKKDKSQALTPAATPTLPSPEVAYQQALKQETEAERKRRLGAINAQSTILTTPEGILGTAPIGRKVLFGQ